MALVMQCARGHALKAPYVFIERINVVGVLTDEMKEQLKAASHWEATDDSGQAKPDGRYLCLDCFLELVQLMDKWAEDRQS